MYARITSLVGTPSGDLAHARDVAPQLWSGAMAQPGCLGGAILADPVAGTTHAITFWSDGDEVIAARQTGTVIAQTAADQLGADPETIVVQLLEVVGLDLEAVVAAANRRGEQWPVIRANDP